MRRLKNDFQRKVIGIGIVLFTILLGYTLNKQSQNDYAKKVKNYLQSTDFKSDFSPKASQSPQQEVLVSYPKITFYFTFEHNQRDTFYESEVRMAEERRCDFIAELFAQMHPNKSQKKAILMLLKQEHIVIENIYRNKYAKILYQTQQPIADCSQWYPNTSS